MVGKIGKVKLECRDQVVRVERKDREEAWEE